MFKQQWGKTYGYIVENWEHAWEELMAYMNFGSHIRRMIYTTNPVEALHRIIRKIVKGKAAWVSETALLKQIFGTYAQRKVMEKNSLQLENYSREIMEKYLNSSINTSDKPGR
ncbi:MAG: transposase [Saprospiraceae bacterium]|nr:transposase [Saprospiraceae bacterium]